MKYAAVLLSAIAVAIATPAFAAVTFDESTQGDIDDATTATDAFGQPTRNFISLSPGINTFTGSISSGGGDDSSDVVPFTIEAGQTLTNLSFSLSNILINNSAQLTLERLGVSPDQTTVFSQDLGNTNRDLSLGAGLYTLLIGSGVNVADYNLQLTVVGPNVAAVPETASWAMMIAGFGLVGGTLRRRAGQVRFAI